jgi:anti-sigma factor RsiW
VRALPGRGRGGRAPEALRRSLEARWVTPPRPRRAPALGRAFAAAAVGAALALLIVFIWQGRVAANAMVAEAVNDHLRLLYSERPVEIASGGVHQVKPWFTGKLDFAPVVGFGGDADFPLEGGAVAFFLDRKAAAFQFKRRLHAITLFVFRADGLPWPTGVEVATGRPRAVASSRGFHVVLWRSGDLGYALVSDVAEADLLTLGAKIAGE